MRNKEPFLVAFCLSPCGVHTQTVAAATIMGAVRTALLQSATDENPRGVWGRWKHAVVVCKDGVYGSVKPEEI